MRGGNTKDSSICVVLIALGIVGFIGHVVFSIVGW